MARLALGAFVGLLLVVAAFPVRTHLTAPHEVVTSTPSDYTGLDHPIELPAKGIACADEILYDTDTRIARFGASAAGGTAPRLRVEALGNRGGQYPNSYASIREIPGGWSGTRLFELPLRPPRTAGFGTFCVRNLGDRSVNLAGTELGRANARPTVTVNREAVPLELKLRLLTGERSSYLSRAGQIMSHASTLRPFGVWWWWLLTIAVVTLAPLGVGLAIRSALPLDAPVVARVRPPASAWPSERLRRRVEAVPGWAVVAAVGVVAGLWFLYYGVHTHIFQNDEDQYVYLSRWFPRNLPESLWDFFYYQRGLQRLEIWLLAIPALLTDSPWSLIGGRALNTAAFVSTSIPVYLLARGMGLSSRWAALPASLSAIVPWAVVTTAFLTENVAYPACLWAVWAIWRAAAAPSLGRDALALALIFVAGLSRTALLVLAPVLPLVVLATGLRCGTGPLVARLRAILRAHVLLWATVAIAALALLGAFGGDVPQRLAGAYGTPQGLDVIAMLEKWGRYLSRVVVGTAFLPAVVALPWLVTALARSRDSARFAFALTLVASAIALLYSLNHAGYDERYIVYLGPLLLLPASVALARREVEPVGLAIASVAVAALIAAVPWNGNQGAFAYFIWPAETFFARSTGSRLDPFLPGGDGAAVVLAALGLGAVGVALAVVLRREPGRLSGRPTALLVGAVATCMLLQTQYAFSKHVNGIGSRTAAGLRSRAFIDELVPKGATVGELPEGAGREVTFFPLWQEVQFYNQRLDRVYSLGDNVNPVPIGDKLITGVKVDDGTGRISSPEPLPDYLVMPTQVGQLRVRGEVIRAQNYVPVQLIRVAKPATAAWIAGGVAVDGAVDKDGASVRVFGTGLRPGPHCVAFGLAAPPNAPVTWELTRDGIPANTGIVEAGQPGRATLSLPDLVEKGMADLRITGRGLHLTSITVDSGC